jgi:PKD repeat protein
MKKLILSCLTLALPVFLNPAIGQTAQGDARPGWCVTTDEYDEHVRQNPGLESMHRQFEDYVSTYEESQPPAAERTSSVVRVIPVVVHVLHECGPENISKEQILDGLRVLNEDYRRLNPDTNNTPIPFRAVAADCEIEFRLAQIDPNGNCTEGIDRVETVRTNSWNPRDSLKRVSYWPTDKYLNIWLVKTIYDQNGSGGIIGGYAHWPWDTTHRAITDGVVIRNDCFGTIGTAAGSTLFPGSRVASHEVGHWLGLYHIWGDDNGACTGSDNCADTPNQAGENYGCPTYPLFDACTPGGNGVMFVNYMDYTDGTCENIFTQNQKSRMNAVLGPAYRSYITSAANLTATGTDGTPAVTCTPIPAVCFDEGIFVCAGNAYTFNNVSYNADTMSYSWSFPGGTPSTSTDEHPVITYATPGTYSFTLTATSSAGSDSITYANVVHVSGPASIIAWSTSTMEDFETPGTFPGDGYVLNPNNGITWQRITSTGYSGTACLSINNFANNNGDIDSYITPGYDVHALQGAQLKFRVANAQRTSTSADELRVYVSNNCGATWTQRYFKSGSQLSTVGVIGSSFFPTSQSQWRLETVNPQISGQANVRFKFENINGSGNNTYIDDINITALSVVGVKEADFEASGFRVYPNPASDMAVITYNLATPGDVSLSITDLTGREVRQVVRDQRALGIHEVHADLSDLSKGVYLVHLQTEVSHLTLRLVKD